MDVLTGLLLVGILFAVSIILPVVSFFRARRAFQIADDLRGRMERLERQVDLHPAQPVPASLMEEPAPLPFVAAAPEPSLTPEPSQTPPVSPTAPVVQDRPGLEQLIGGRWLLYAGIAAVVLAASYFVKFAFDNGWISEPLRVAAGVGAGVVLVAGGTRISSRGLAIFGHALAGGGIVVLYVSIYAALHFYRLIAPAPAFGLMAMVTAAAAWLADRQQSQPLAALALLGGFATPLLIGGGQGAQIVLFTYVAILITGSALIAHRHDWPLVSAASYVCAFALVVAWLFSSYTPGAWFRTELFLTLYACLFGYLLWALLRSGDRSSQAQLAIGALATAPFAYHLASLVLLNQHPWAWLVYLVLVTLAGLLVSHRTRAAWLRVAVLVLVGIPGMVWLEALPYPRWYAPALVTLFALYGLHLASQWEAASEEGTGAGAPVIEVVHTQLTGLLLPLSLFVFIETRFAWSNPWMVAALSAWNAGLAAIASRGAPRLRLQFVVLAATLAAVALVLAFDGPVVPLGWVAEGVLIGWLSMRERSRRLGIGGGMLIAMGSLQLIYLLATPLQVADKPVLNPRTFAAALVIGLLAWLAGRMRDDPDPHARGRARDGVIVLANLLGVVLLSADIHAYFSQRALDAVLDGEASGAAAARLAGQVMLSVAWAAYAVALIAIGIRRGYAPARYFAIVLFAATVMKVLFHDIAGLDRLNRMLSVFGVGVLLLVASYLYQRMAAQARVEGR
ncbi:MAG TPA: DUF2339 domain-containing protein [Vicinamibacterales bacterium]|nr:DUF2339 domain-containing protein [Vicinamibacterales bacterium]